MLNEVTDSTISCESVASFVESAISCVSLCAVSAASNDSEICPGSIITLTLESSTFLLMMRQGRLLVGLNTRYEYVFISLTT